jgi:hypothetical protein
MLIIAERSKAKSAKRSFDFGFKNKLFFLKLSKFLKLRAILNENIFKISSPVTLELFRRTPETLLCGLVSAQKKAREV